jgi:hypothetical protein
MLRVRPFCSKRPLRNRKCIVVAEYEYRHTAVLGAHGLVDRNAGPVLVAPRVIDRPDVGEPVLCVQSAHYHRSKLVAPRSSMAVSHYHSNLGPRDRCVHSPLVEKRVLIDVLPTGHNARASVAASGRWAGAAEDRVCLPRLELLGQHFTGPMTVALACLWGETRTSGCAMLLATGLQNVGAYAEAERAFRDVLEACVARYGPTHEATLVAMGKLASAMQPMWNDEGKRAESEALWRGAHACRVRTLGAEHPLTLASQASLALVLS